MLYGSMVWLAFLLITLAVRFKSQALRKYVNYMDLFFFLFHIGMWLWLVYIWLDEEWFEQCSDPVNLFGFVYLVLGFVALLMLAISLCGCVIGRLRKDDEDGLRGLYDTEDVDFDPYQ